MGDVYAIPEGTPIFPGEPMMRKSADNAGAAGRNGIA